MLEIVSRNVMQRMAAVFLATLVLGLGGCASEEKTGEGGAASGETILYAEGFSDQERDGANSWRWMEPEGVVKLKNTGREMVLKITGRPPVEQLAKMPKIKIALNGVTLEEVAGSAEVLTREYAITAAQQGGGEWSELRIYSDEYFVPKNVYKNSTDERRLAFSLTSLSWQPK
jgi:hypothetical protein